MTDHSFSFFACTPSVFSVLLALLLLSSAAVSETSYAQTTETVFSGPCVICEPATVAFAEVTGDSHKDLVVGEQGTKTVTVYPGTGSGTGLNRFGAGIEIASVTDAVTDGYNFDRPEDLATGDFNGDGTADIAIASSSADVAILVVISNADGSFQSPTTVAQPAQLGTVVTADFDGTNEQDLMWGEPNGGLTLAPNDGTGSFPSADHSSRNLNVDDLDVDNYDGDGDPDVGLADGTFGDIIVLQNDGTTDVSSWPVQALNFSGVSNVTFTSLNGNAAIAGIAGGSSSSTINVHEKDGSSTNLGFNTTESASLTSPIDANLNAVEGLVSRDFSGNSNPDDLGIIGEDGGTSKTHVFENQSSSFNDLGANQLTSFRGPVNGFTVGTVNSDNDLDIVGGVYADDTVLAGLNDGSGNLNSTEQFVDRPKTDAGTPFQVPGTPIGTTPDRLVALDIDSDAFSEVGAAGETKVVLFDNGSGGITDHQVFNNLAAGDVEVLTDSDGPDKLLVAAPSGGFVLRPDGSKNKVFSDGMGTITSADFNGSGEKGIVGGTSSEVKAVTRNSDGTFNSPQTILSEKAFDLGTGPIDASKRTGLAAGSQNVFIAGENGLKRIEWTGSGFGSAVTIASGFRLRVQVGDLDDDGDIDIVVFTGSGVTLYLNNGDGTFTEGNFYTSFVALGLALLNQDGLLDFISGDRWRPNTSSTSSSIFGNESFFTSQPRRESNAAGDADGDGDKDPFLTASGSEKAAWYENDDSNLPVELTSFEGTQTGKSLVQLQWTTASEQNNAGFNVQHKRGETWAKMGYVESKSSGTTSQPTQYAYTAEGLSPGTHKFRLKQIDLDGTETVLESITVDLQMEDALRFAAPRPNPVSGPATASFAVKGGHRATVTLYNVLGQKVKTLYDGTPKSGEAQQLRIETADLASGVYVVRLKANGKSRSRRLTVIR